MTEIFLHYVWQYQQYNFNGLKTTGGQPVKVIKPGLLNAHSGPDFSNARLLIGSIEWVGQVEIHLFSSDWNAHRHSNDRAYDNVILHVVWEETEQIFRKEGTAIPTIELKDIVNANVLWNYNNLLRNPADILCEPHFGSCSDLSKYAMMDKAMVTRLESKTADIFELLNKNKNDWELTSYQWIARNFGFKLNAEAFFRLSEVLPLRVVRKHQGSLFQLESLVFGQAGFLEEPEGEYALKLENEYCFLAEKYNIYEKRMSRHEWKFLRTRPGNFPTLRLAQFARLLNNNEGLFSFFTETREVSVIVEKLGVVQSGYWQEHYDFGKKSRVKLSGIGETSLENLVINTVVNLLSAYSASIDTPVYAERAIEILESIKPEKNHITEKWKNLGIAVKSGFDSQALIQQYNAFCLRKRCVQCPVGAELLRR